MCCARARRSLTSYAISGHSKSALLNLAGSRITLRPWQAHSRCASTRPAGSLTTSASRCELLFHGAQDSGLGKALTGLADPGGQGSLKTCRLSALDVHRVVVEEQHPLGWHLEHACDLGEGRDIRFEQAQLEGQK